MLFVKMASYKDDTTLLLVRVVPWLLSASLVTGLALFSIVLTNEVEKRNDVVTVRKLDVVLPPPPPPELPPPKAKASVSDSPTIDVLGTSGGVVLSFSDKPELSLTNLEKVEKPDFDVATLDLRQSLTLDFPIVEVNELDSVPRAISTTSTRYPRSLVKRGIKRVDTQVELIIDQQGRAYIKKIVDPVYPEMIEPIRKWVKGVKFTIPTKNGRPTQAIYLYTLRFIYRV